MLFKVTVLPPVLGPVIATTRNSADTSTEIGTTAGPSSCFSCHTSNGWRRFSSRNGASGRASSWGTEPPSQRP